MASGVMARQSEEAVQLSSLQKVQVTEMEIDWEVDMGLIPALPDDVAYQCLLRVPVQSHAHLSGVSRKWRELIHSPAFYEERKKVGTTKYFVCMLQALPQVESPSVEKQDALQPLDFPVYGISVFDVQLQSWERLSAIPELAEGFPHFCRMAAVGGKLVVLGGWNPATWEPLRSVYVYNFSTQSWRRGADMPTVRSFFACGAVGNNVLVAGGHDNGKAALSSAEVYNLDSDRWESLPSMSEQRDECTGVAIDGKFCVASGYATASQGSFVKSAEVYDPASNTWCRIEEMWALAGSSDSNPGAFAVLAGSLYAFSGKQLVCYSATKNAWSAVDCLPESEKEGLTPVCVTATNDSIIVTGPGRCGEFQKNKTLIYKFAVAGTSTSKGRKSEWEAVESDQFVGVAQASCVVEV